MTKAELTALAESVEQNTYRGWSISPAYIGWSGCRPNFDTSYEGPEDGWVHNGEQAWGRTRAELIEEIDDWFEDHSDAEG